LKLELSLLLNANTAAQVLLPLTRTMGRCRAQAHSAVAVVAEAALL
jgi:hypothetical protein